jgi:uncharacterized metal-binding protein
MKKKRSKKIGFVLIFLILIILFAIGFLAVKEFDLIPEKKQNVFQLEDECGVFLGQMLHSIKDEGSCETNCEVRCSSTDLKFKKVLFEESRGGCHSCTCYCR